MRVTPRGLPGRGTVMALAAAVLAMHLLLLSGLGGLATVLLPAPAPERVQTPPTPTLQTRLIGPTAAVTPPTPAPPRTDPGRASARLMADPSPARPAPVPAAVAPAEDPAAPAPSSAASDPAAPAPATERHPPVPTFSASADAASASGGPDAPPDAPVDTAPSAASDPLRPPSLTDRAADPTTANAAPNVAQNTTANASQNPVSGPAAPSAGASASTTEPGAAPGSGAATLRVDRAGLPPSQLLDYAMTGEDRGLRYHASGELRWQHNDSHYALQLTVRALLLGSREWRSQGLIGPQGLQPLRFSDKRRTERATHFDHDGGRVVFSGGAAPVPLAPGAQDQISLYVQMAAALASAPGPMAAGTQLQVQTATTRDALPWLLTLQGHETLRLQERSIDTAHWVCLPRQRFDARIELWTAAPLHHLPARIRITQASGSFIDLQLRSQQDLAPLPAVTKP